MKEPKKSLTTEELSLLIADRARSSRLYNVYTQSELSKRSGVSYATIRKFERTGEISLKSLLKIAHTLGEDLPFHTLFHYAEYFSMLSPKVFKRPILHKNGTYFSSRILSPRELERALDMEDSPGSYVKKEPKRVWKKNTSKTDSNCDPNWDPFAEMELMANESSSDDLEEGDVPE